jgi:hypothetical protein
VAADAQYRSATSVLCGLFLIVLPTGCSAVPDEPAQWRLSRQYFRDNNAAAALGPQAQQNFFQRTQHPDFADRTCDLAGSTVDLDPAFSTLRPDPGFSPGGALPPRGDVWVIGVEVTTRRDGGVSGRQIGSQHLVFLDGRAYGFAPCPS